MTTTGDRHVMIRVTRERSSWGVGDDSGAMTWLLDVLVEPDGNVLAWDAVAEHYTWCHDLTEAEMTLARKMAARQGAPRREEVQP